MPGLLSKLLGARVAPTSENIAAEQAARRVALAKAQGIVAAAAQARARALDDLDADGMARADEAAAAGGRTVEIEERALALLDGAHTKAVEAEQAAARAATVAALVERRRVLGARLESEYRAAAATMAAVLSSVATLARDIKEAGAEREVERLFSVPRGLPLNSEAVVNVSAYLGDALSSPPVVGESPKERAWREAEEARARRKAEEAEARRIKAEREREEGRAAREAEETKTRDRERDPYYPSRSAMRDAAR